MKALTDILSEVQEKIAAAAARAGRDVNDVEILAVTKTHGEDVVREAWQSGLSIMAENKVQEAAWKKPASPSGPSWHLIGHLQTNKVRQALSLFDFIHSVDSIRLIEKLNTISEETGARPGILLEVNVSGESSKTGMSPNEVDKAVELLLTSPRLSFEGFMTMAPFSDNPEDSRPFFRRLRQLRDDVEKRFSLSLPRLSMGMSNDYEVAVEEGATWLRLGTVLFGERPKITKKTNVSFSGLDSYSGEGPTFKILD
ncbi:MAG: YggS family pyridoxal phosphate-dependent enzyme [Kiritimatiellae bacterium]|nr:YggS family pyridoxal phosphate-dependent enzyme [Kiritimatiellia bacterium]